MPNSIQDLLNAISNARYGAEVRSSIHDAIEMCYENVTASQTTADAAATRANTAADSAEDATVAANSAATSATAAVASTTTAISNANAATTSANSAASSANQAATNANTARGNAATAANTANQAAVSANQARDAAVTATSAAQTATTAAETATTRANNAADSATAAANEATLVKDDCARARIDTVAATNSANTATTRANAASASIEGLTVTSETVGPDAEGGAEVSDVDGHKNIHFILKQGAQGAPNIVKGSAYASLSDLEAEIVNPAIGDQYNVGTEAPYNIYRWTGEDWEDQGQIGVNIDNLTISEIDTIWNGTAIPGTNSRYINHTGLFHLIVNKIKAALNNKVDKVTGKGLSSNDFTSTYINQINNHDSQIQALSSTKVDKVTGKDLSTNDFTDAYKAQIGTNTTDITSLRSQFNNTPIAKTVNGKTGTVVLDSKDIDISEASYFTSEPSDVPIQQAIDETEKADARIYGGLTNFMYAYRVPSTESFTAQDILTAAANEKQVYSTYSWDYITTVDPDGTYPLSDIPLYNPATPDPPLNKNGKVTSCATAITNILHRLGLTDIANPSASDTEIRGKTRYSEARRSECSLPHYLQQRGWTMIHTESELTAGDIVFCRRCVYPDERRYNPAHTFIYVTATTAYDFGSQTNVRSGGTDAIDWRTGGSIATFGWRPTLFGFVGDANDPYVAGDTLWSGRTTQRILSDGTPALVAELQNADSLRYVDIITSVNAESGQLVSNRIQYPITVTTPFTNHSGLFTKVKLYKSGTIRCSFFGTSNNISKSVGYYVIFSFNSFTNPKHKFFTYDTVGDAAANAEKALDIYTPITASGVIGHFYTHTENNITTIRMSVSADIPNGTAISAFWQMQLN